MSGIYAALQFEEIKATLPLDYFKEHYPFLGFQVVISDDLYQGYLSDLPTVENTGFPYAFPFEVLGAYIPPEEN